jgi:excinuclease UvrABC nuclease subunit
MEDIPDTAGVYFFKDSKEKIIYIGKARSLSSRLKSYTGISAPSKARKIISKADHVEHRITHNELFALLLETTLVKQFNPPMNTMLKRYPQNYFIKVRRTEDFPDLSVSTAFDFDGNDYFGPYNNRENANKIIEVLNKTFELRECSDKEFAKKKKCYLADLHRCLAPCIDSGAAGRYEEELNRVYQFLENDHQPAIDRLLGKMKDLSVNMKYEQAAEVRDTINLLLDQFSKTSLLSEPVNSCNVLIEIISQTHNDYLLIIEGKVIPKDLFEDSEGRFEDALDNYYRNSIELFPGIMEKDLEYLKISLNWLIKNKTRIRSFYLKEYGSKSELFASAGL